MRRSHAGPVTPLGLFFRTLARSSAVFLGAGWIFMNPSLEPRATREVTAQRSPREAAVEGLVTAAADSDPRVRRQAVEALGGTPHGRARPVLIQALGDECEEVRLAAGRALCRRGERDWCP